MQPHAAIDEKLGASPQARFSGWAVPNTSTISQNALLQKVERDNTIHTEVYEIEINAPPVLAEIGDKTAAEGDTLAFTVSASDMNGTTPILSVGQLPQGASFDAESSQFTWSPTYEQSGSFTVVFTASDGELSDSETVIITVIEVNRQPVAVDDTGTTNEVEEVTIDVLANDSDPDNDPLTISQVSTLPMERPPLRTISCSTNPTRTIMAAIALRMR